MLKFVVLSVLALGCYSQTYQPRSYGFSSGYGSGYGGSTAAAGGYGYNVQPSGYSFGGRSFGGASNSGQNLISLGGQYGAGLGFYGYSPLVSGARFGGLSSGAIQYRQVAGAAAQPVATAFIAQPVAVQSGLAINAQPIAAQQVSRIAHVAHEAKPSAISFLTQHHSEPYQEVIQAAVQQVGRTVEYKSMPHQDQPLQPQVVEVEPSETPLHIHFKTKSSSVSLSQSHQQQAPQEAQLAQTQDEPSRVMHEIQKPIIQEVREVITPYRQVTQEIHPVVEAVHTVVTKAEGQRQQYAAPQYQPSTTGAVQQFSAVAAAQPISVGQQSIAVARPIASGAATVAVQPLSIQYQPAQSIAVAAEPLSVGYQTVNYAAAQPVASYAIAAQPSSFGTIQTSSVQPIQSYKFEIPSSSNAGFESSGSSFVVGQPISTSSSSFSSNSGSFSAQPLSTSSGSVRSGSIESRNY